MHIVIYVYSFYHVNICDEVQDLKNYTMSPKSFFSCYQVCDEVQELQQKIRKIDFNICENKKKLTEREDRLPLVRDVIFIESSWDEDLEDLSNWKQLENKLMYEIIMLKNTILRLLEKKRKLHRELLKIEHEI